MQKFLKICSLDFSEMVFDDRHSMEVKMVFFYIYFLRILIMPKEPPRFQPLNFRFTFSNDGLSADHKVLRMVIWGPQTMFSLEVNSQFMLLSEILYSILKICF